MDGWRLPVKSLGVDASHVLTSAELQLAQSSAAGRKVHWGACDIVQVLGLRSWFGQTGLWSNPDSAQSNPLFS
jgi:hypothetical protein